MSELSVAQSLQTLLRTTTISTERVFSDSDVTINNWSVLDGSFANAPYIVIETSEEFDSRQDTYTPNTRWQMPVYLVIHYTSRDQAHNDIMTIRQAIIDKLNSGGRTGNGITIDRIYSSGGFIEIYDKYIPENEIVDPDYIAQTIMFDVEEF